MKKCVVFPFNICEDYSNEPRFVDEVGGDFHDLQLTTGLWLKLMGEA
jgi:hypothetical protein